MRSDFTRPREQPAVSLPEHLDLIAAAPSGIHKLRGLILELAVRGKLVPQNPNDEPASELLKRIAQERARLEAAGTCKKSKATPLVGEEEQPFALPASWAWTRLGEVTNFGQTDKDGEIRDTTWVLDLEDIQKDTSVLLRKVRFAERQAKSDKNRFHEGDVLYGKLRPYLNKVIFAVEEGVCTTEILPVRGYYGIFPRYLMHALKRPDFLAYVNSKSYGMKMPRLGTDDGRLALFPLPPEREQHRIVAKVDELMALCDLLEAEQADAGVAHVRLVETLLGTLTQSADAAELAANWQRLAEHFDTLFTTESSLDALKQTILQLAVMGKLVPQNPNDEPASELLKRIAKERARLEAEGVCKKMKAAPLSKDEQTFEVLDGWTRVTLPDLCLIGGGATPSKEKSAYWGSGIPWVSPKDMKVDQIFDAQDHVTELALTETSLSRIANGSLLVVVRGMILVHSLPVALTRVEVAINQDMKSLTPFRSEILPFLALACKGYKKQILGLVERSTHGTCKLQSKKLSAFLFGLPPLAEQHRIIAKVDELMALCDRLKAGLAESRTQQERLAATLIESAL